MTLPRHRGVHSRARTPRASARALAGVLVVGALAGSFAGVRAVAGGGPDPRTKSFAGVVTDFADEGAVMCVRPRGRPEAPFCDLFYVPPGTPRLRVGDDVLVTTIASRTEDGAHMSGMLVAPVH